EAGQSAFGDVYAWFSDLLCWPLERLREASGGPADGGDTQAWIDKIKDQLLSRLSEEAAAIEPTKDLELAVDWLNGRRTPDANQLLKGAVRGLTLGSDAPRVFRSLVEATCFGAKMIVERYQQEGIPVKGVIGVGGIA